MAGTELEKASRPASLTEYVKAKQSLVEAVLPRTLGMEADLWIASMQGLLRKPKNKTLLAAAKRNPESLLFAMLDCATLGHRPDSREFAFVTFKDEIQGIEEYRGVIERMYRAAIPGSFGVQAVHYGIVHYNDEFDPETGDHTFDWRDPSTRGDMIGVYAWAELPFGVRSQVIYLDRATVMKSRAVARNKAIWDGDFGFRMWIKTALHRLEAVVPTSVEYRRQQAQQAAQIAAAGSDLPPGYTPPTDARFGDPGQPGAADDGAEIEGEVVDWPETAQPAAGGGE